MDDESVRTGFDGRNGRGLFAPGNKIAKGNLLARRMAELRRLALETETPEQVSRVFVKLRELALEGDVAAARTYLTFTIGRPPQAVELSGAGGRAAGAERRRGHDDRPVGAGRPGARRGPDRPGGPLQGAGRRCTRRDDA